MSPMACCVPRLAERRRLLKTRTTMAIIGVIASATSVSFQLR